MTQLNATISEVEIIDRHAGSGPVAGPSSAITAKVRLFLNGGEEIFPELREQEHFIRMDRPHTIAGLRQGIQGMSAGGVREIVIAPALAYGEKGVPGVIPPDATLRCEVRLLKVA